MKAFPMLLRRRLTEESHLRLALQRLGEQASAIDSEIESRRSSQTSVDFLMAVAKRPRASTQAISEMRKSIEDLAAFRSAIEQLIQEIGREIVELTEAHVRDTDETYLRGLAAFENAADWERALKRFEARLKQFRAALGEARNMASANYDRTRNRISSSAEESVSRAIGAGTTLEEEIAFVNQVIATQAELLAGTPAEGAALAKIPLVGYADWTRRLRELPIAEMQVEFDRIITYCEELMKTGVPALQSTVSGASAQGMELSRGYILSYVDTLRSYADTTWLNPEETDGYLEHLEKRYGKKLGGRAPSPAQAETAFTSPDGTVATPS